MGKKLNLTQLQLGAANVKKNGGVGKHVCMSLTTDVPVGEAKVSLSKLTTYILSLKHTCIAICMQIMNVPKT